MPALLLLLFVLLMPFCAWAEPDVTGVDAALVHGSSVTITGSGFGAKSPAAPLIWDNGESCTVDSDSSVLDCAPRNDAATGWDEAWPDSPSLVTSYRTRYRNEGFRSVPAPHSRSTKYLSGGHYTYPDNTPNYLGSGAQGYANVLVTVDSGTADKDIWYASWYMRLDPLWPGETTDRCAWNLKEEVFQTSPNAYQYGFAYTGFCGTSGAAYFPGVGTPCRLLGEHGYSDACDMSCPQATSFSSPTLAWIKRESRHWNDGSHAQRDLYVNNIKVYTHISPPDCSPVLDTRSFSIGGYFRVVDETRLVDGCTCDTSCWGESAQVAAAYIASYSNNAWRYFDDLYVDTTFSRVMIGNAATYSACTKIEPQIPTDWADGSITVTVNLGSFTDEETKYIYVFDSTDTPNAVGREVTGITSYSGVTFDSDVNITMSGSLNYSFENCTFNDARLYIGGDASASGTVTITDNTWNSTDSYAITLLKNGSGSVLIDGNYVYGDAESTTSAIIVRRNPGTTTISNNVIYFFPEGNGVLVEEQRSDTATVGNVTITGNTTTDCLGGIWLLYRSAGMGAHVDLSKTTTITSNEFVRSCYVDFPRPENLEGDCIADEVCVYDAEEDCETKTAGTATVSGADCKCDGLPVFGDCEGYGCTTTGGRQAGGAGTEAKLCVVDSLGTSNTDGCCGTACDPDRPTDVCRGTFEYCVENTSSITGARILVFSTGGILDESSSIVVGSQYASIFGQTAPGDGFVLTYEGDGLANAWFKVQADDVLIQGLRFRQDDYNYTSGYCQTTPAISQDNAIDTSDGGAATEEPRNNIVIDRCSFSWACNETTNIAWYSGHSNQTISNCIISEGLTETDNGHGLGMNVGDILGITVHHNLFAHNADRNPKFGSHTGTALMNHTDNVECFNNVIYNWEWKASSMCSNLGDANTDLVHVGYTGGGPRQQDGDFINNYYRPGGNTNVTGYPFQFYVDGSIGGTKTLLSDAEIYLSGNVTDNSARTGFTSNTCASGADGCQWTMVQGDAGQITKETTKQCYPPSGADVTEIAQNAYSRVLAFAGAQSTLNPRDAVDERIVLDVIEGTGAQIVNTTGLWPTYSAGTAPTDSDLDGLPDSYEATIGTAIGDADSDDDGIEDWQEDTDGDGYWNIEDYAYSLLYVPLPETDCSLCPGGAVQ